MNDMSQNILPVLRDEITVEPGATDRMGVASWIIYDPLQHRYHQINRETKDLIAILQTGKTTDELISSAWQNLKIRIDQRQVENLLEFLQKGQLLVEPATQGWQKHAELESGRSQSLTTKLMHSYLFVKIPLFHPQTMLQRILPFLGWMYTPLFFIIVGLCGLAGIYLVSHHWSEFTHDAQSLFTLQGAAYFGLALVIIKSLHELAHAFTAARFGCRVPTMGIALFLLTPLLYTDVSDAWRLSSRSQRLWISAAGIIIELVIACLATFLWAFLPEGTSRNVVLMVASVSWIMSLFINLNPLIKFDGYYLLSDILGIDNLQQRSFAFGKWKLREILFSPGADRPEQLPRKLGNTLVIFAWMTWVHRLILFTAIALVVYHFTFKLLGIFLFALEIWLLVARPVIAEVLHWIKMDHGNTSPHRAFVTLGIVALICGVFLVPWSTKIRIPAILEAAELSTIYPGREGKVVSIMASRGDYVEKDSPLVRLHNPVIESKLSSAAIELDLIKLRLANVIVENFSRDSVLVLKQKIRSRTSEIDGLLAEKNELVIKAPISGMVREFNRNIHKGRWINKTVPIALIASPGTHRLRGYIPGIDIQRLSKSTFGKFIPDDLGRSSIEVTLKTIATAAAPVIDIAALASVNGGSVGVEVNDRKQLIPNDAQYLIVAEPAGTIQTADQIISGIIQFRGSAQSYVTRIWNQIGKILIRETGF